MISSDCRTNLHNSLLLPSENVCVQDEEFDCRTGPEACPKTISTTATFQLISCCCSAHVKTGLRLLSLSIDLFGKVHYVIEENKFNAPEQLHLKTREDC